MNLLKIQKVWIFETNILSKPGPSIKDTLLKCVITTIKIHGQAV